MKPVQILHLECSPRPEACSSRLGRHLSAALQAETTAPVQVRLRALGVEPLPALSAAYAGSLILPIAQARARYGEQLALSDALCEELAASDVLLISAPVHNFGIPAVLKNWIDWVVRRDVTFALTAEGKIGLLADRPVLVAVTSGGAMFRDPPAQPDFFRPYLRAALGGVGLTRIEFVEAPGLAFSAAPEEAVDALARDWIRRRARPAA
ncbi:FMN-dependent NADH-azoreductase [Pseudaquabacterium rugosum]|uniref:FMN dependent NADH:quinone oxidoreductase n=1 Tax=Pseudaquabacterium rugosum TaxID=2984194 RepID=A0ABU9BB62_9BURK